MTSSMAGRAMINSSGARVSTTSRAEPAPMFFVLDRASGTSADQIRDFVSGTDTLAVRGSDYGLAAGTLPDASYFALAGDATDVGHGRFLYNQATANLSWDADGQAATANVTIATLSP